MRRVLVVIVLACLAGACTTSEVEPEALPTAGTGPEGVARCLQERGWNAEAQADGSITASYPAEQEDQYRADLDQCITELGLDAPAPPMTEAEAEEFFDALLASAECVRDLGYHVDEPPSRQAAVQALMQPVIDLDGWDPYNDPELNAGSQDEINEVYTACPRPERP